MYSPAFNGGWLSDDKMEITGNANLRDAGGLARIWLGEGSRDYLPVKDTVQWLQWHLWRDQPLGYHLTSVALHLAGAFLLWRLLGKLGVRLGWLGGLLFAVHPLAVESVAWISELKNTLSLPPLLLAACAYADYDRDGRKGRLRASVGWFLAAMLCKASVVMFPAGIALYALWRHGRVRWADVKSLAPFAAISTSLGLVTVWFQENRAIGQAAAAGAGLASRVAAAGLAAAFYLGKSLWPAGLTFCYPKWAVDPPQLWQFLPWVAPVALAAWLATMRGKPGPSWVKDALFCLGWFFLNLVPVLGLVPMSYQVRYSWVADHFAYVSLTGVAALAAAGIGLLPSGGRAGRMGAAALAAALVLGLGWIARGHAAHFTDETTLWNHTHQLNPGAWSAETEAWRHAKAGNALMSQGRAAEAAAEFEAALRLNPQYAEAHTNLGKVLLEEGRVEEAAAQLEAALDLDPQIAQAHNNLGAALQRLPGRLPEALAEFAEAVRLAPEDPEARNNLGMALAQSGRTAEAQDELNTALQLRPGFAEAHNSLGIVLAQSGRLAGSLGEFSEAARLDPRSVPARRNLTRALIGSNRIREAADSAAQWVRLSPEDPEARQALEALLRATGAGGQSGP